MKSSSIQNVKDKTIYLYDQLSSDEVTRKNQTDIRDEIFSLNYKFFGYVASHTYIENSAISYEDKFQSACAAFMEIWWKYRYAPKYRTDLSFGVFFKPRLSEMIERELMQVRYSTRRSLCMKVGNQIGKHWSKVRYDDLSNPEIHIKPEELASLKAIFGVPYIADLELCEIFLEADKEDIFKMPSDNYSSITDFLIHEMIIREEKLTDSILLELSDMYTLNYWDLKHALPEAENKLYNKLHANIDIMASY